MIAQTAKMMRATESPISRELDDGRKQAGRFRAYCHGMTTWWLSDVKHTGVILLLSRDDDERSREMPRAAPGAISADDDATTMRGVLPRYIGSRWRREIRPHFCRTSLPPSLLEFRLSPCYMPPRLIFSSPRRPARSPFRHY